MAFPAVVDADTKTTNNTADVTSHLVTVATNVGVDDWCEVELTVDAESGAAPTLTWPTGWEQVAFSNYTGTDPHVLEVRRKKGPVADFTVESSNAQRSVAISRRITGAHATDPWSASTVVITTTTAPDPGSLTPAAGSQDYLWIALHGRGHGARTTDAYPTNYLGGTNVNGGSASTGIGAASAYRQLTAATEDPGAFTLSGAAGASSFTIAIPPAAGGGMSIALPTVIETSTAQPLIGSKRKTLPMVTESDLAQSLSAGKRRSLPLVTEIDSAQVLGRSKSKALPLVTEIDSALMILGGKRHSLATVVETNTAVALTGRKTKLLGVVVETDLAIGLVARKSRLLGVVVETDLAIGLLSVPLALPGRVDRADIQSRGRVTNVRDTRASRDLRGGGSKDVR